MKAISIPATNQTPKVVLDPNSNYFELSGKCLPEDSTLVFHPILDWLDHFAVDPKKPLVFNFKMDYFNTSSSKYILEILLKLEEIHEKSDNVLVKWFFSEGDDDMEEAGEDYSDLVEIPFQLESF